MGPPVLIPHFPHLASHTTVIQVKKAVPSILGEDLTRTAGSMSSSRRHIPYLSFHKEIIREICRPQKDDLLIMAKGLGMRRVICALLKTYDRKEDLVLVVRLLCSTGGDVAESQVNASPADEAGIGDELGIMGVRDPGFRILTYEMPITQR